MDVQHQDHRRGAGELELNIETDFDDHEKKQGRGGSARKILPSAK
jgi:hypothetical protein